MGCKYGIYRRFAGFYGRFRPKIEAATFPQINVLSAPCKNVPWVFSYTVETGESLTSGTDSTLRKQELDNADKGKEKSGCFRAMDVEKNFTSSLDREENKPFSFRRRETQKIT
jgi:hypothetical protein